MVITRLKAASASSARYLRQRSLHRLERSNVTTLSVLTVLLQQRPQSLQFLPVENRNKRIPLGVVKRQAISLRRRAKLKAGLEHLVVDFQDFVLQCTEIHQMTCSKTPKTKQDEGVRIGDSGPHFAEHDLDPICFAGILHQARLTHLFWLHGASDRVLSGTLCITT